MRERLARLVLAVLAANGLLVGLWALLAPRSFHDDFPGLGRAWVAPGGPYSEHLVRDVGALNLALALVAGVAAVRLTVLLARTAAAAWLVFAVPHLAYHAANLAPFGTADRAGLVGALATTALLPAVLLVLTGRPLLRAGSH